MVLETPGLLERLLVLLDDPNTVAAALRAIGNIVAGDDEQTQCVIDAGVLPKLVCYCRSKKSVEREAFVECAKVTYKPVVFFFCEHLFICP